MVAVLIFCLIHLSSSCKENELMNQKLMISILDSCHLNFYEFRLLLVKIFERNQHHISMIKRHD